MMCIRSLRQWVALLPAIFGLWAASAGGADEPGKLPFHVGYRTCVFHYAYPDGRRHTMTTAVWYPTRDEPTLHTYPDRAQPKNPRNPWSLRSQLAVDAKPAEGGPFPLVLFCHGGFGCALNSAFFTEYLASHGFVVVAPDFEDTIPPDFTRQLAFSRLGDGNVAPPLLVLRALKKFLDVLNGDREQCLSYMTKFRWQPARFLTDQMLAANREEGCPFRGLIDENSVGIMGHSLGGLTSLGVIGTRPELHDKRIKAALIFSAPVYPVEEGIGKIAMPVMVMYGDNDPNALGPQYPRRLLYERGRAPRFCMVLKNATHFAFGNTRCRDLSALRGSSPQARVIEDYGTAFFRRYLKDDREAEALLSRTDGALARYRMEMEPGREGAWGNEPTPRKGAGPGGIREEIGKWQADGADVGKGAEEPAAYQPSGRFRVKVVKDIAYYDGPDTHPKKHKLDLFLPEGKKAFPVLMFIHGGGWRGGDKDHWFGMYGKLGRTFAQEGIGTAVISYRLSPQVIHPEHVRDCARAFAWLHKHIGEYGGRNDRIFVTGQSAGGHLTALLLTNEKFLHEHGLSAANIAGAIPISGVYRVNRNLFRAFGEDPGNWADACPITHARGGLPPFLILLGDGDFRGADVMAKGFARALESHGNRVALKIIPDRTHISIITKVGTKGDQTTGEMLRFIRTRLEELNDR